LKAFGRFSIDQKVSSADVIFREKWAFEPGTQNADRRRGKADYRSRPTVPSCGDLSQTGGRTYSEGLSLRWDQVDLQNKLIHLDNNVKTEGSTEPIPLSDFACAVLQAWKKEAKSSSPYLFQSPKKLGSADFNGEDRLEGGSQSGRSAALSNLYVAGMFSALV
jgi:integrase